MYGCISQSSVKIRVSSSHRASLLQYQCQNCESVNGQLKCLVAINFVKLLSTVAGEQKRVNINPCQVYIYMYVASKIYQDKKVN